MNDSMRLEAEASVVGGLLIDFPRTKQALLELTPGEFYNEDFRLAFEKISAIDQRGDKVDFITVISELGGNPEMKVTLAQTVQMIPSLGNYESYVSIVKNEAQRRRLVEGMQEMCFGAYNSSEIITKLSEIIETEQTKDNTYREDMMLYKVAEYRGSLYDGDNKSKILTGYSDLDRMLGGLAKRNFTVIGARPSMGKTAFAGCVAANLVDRGHKVDFFSIEMTANQLFDRFGSNKQSIDHNRLRDRKTSAEENEAVIKSLRALTENKNFYLFDDFDSIEKMESIIAKNRPAVAIIDYLQLATTNVYYREVRDQVSHISKACKRIAKRYDCHVIALAQLSRDVERRKSKVPILADLRDCGQIEQDADTVIFLYREYVYNKNKSPEPASVIVAKNRHGETGILDFRFIGKYQRFVQVDKKHEDWKEVPGTGWPPAPEQTKL